MMIRVLRVTVFSSEKLTYGSQLEVVAACCFANANDGGLTMMLTRMMDCRMSEHRCCSLSLLHICTEEKGS